MNKRAYDLLIVGMLLCFTLSGIYIGERLQQKKTQTFFIDYINNECVCEKELIIEDNKISYEKEIITYKKVPNLT